MAAKPPARRKPVRKPVPAPPLARVPVHDPRGALDEIGYRIVNVEGRLARIEARLDRMAAALHRLHRLIAARESNPSDSEDE